MKIPAKVPHIAFFTQEAMMHPVFAFAAMGESPILEIPDGYINGQIECFWITLNGAHFAVFRFEVWEKQSA